GSRLSALPSGRQVSPLRRTALALCIPFALDAAAQISINLAPTDYNGYHISCFGEKDGAIDATVSGGSPPYTYEWSNAASTEDVSDLASGYYKLSVTDALNEIAAADITLVEPEQMKVLAEPFKYPSGHNISCHDCFNGSIDVSVLHGVRPYSYDWGDEVYTQDRTGLGALSYAVVVTDANGCEARSEKLLLTQPERKDWTMEGNANTNPGQHFFGTTDAQDVVFKSNGAEALRLLPTGQIKLPGQTAGLLMKRGDGVIDFLDPMPSVPCAAAVSYQLPRSCPPCHAAISMYGPSGRLMATISARCASRCRDWAPPAPPR
ncbi:MAG: SprB repeat-containing protein, partial [Flavobacteriales bacterium]